MSQVKNLVLPSIVEKRISEFSLNRRSSTNLYCIFMQLVGKMWGRITALISPFLLLLLPMIFGLLIYSGQYRTPSNYKASDEKARPVVIREANARLND